MEEMYSRTEMLLGRAAIAKLQNARVAVFGVGGVGGYIVEALARAGVGTLDLIDKDVVSLSNLNRQIIALHSTLGKSKVEVAATRALDINPAIKIHCHNCFYLPENADNFDFSQYDYVADAVDTVSAKISLVERAKAARVPIICAMGAGNKLHAEMFQVSDISKTSVCPLAKVMRKELRQRGINHVKVVYSQEEAIKPSGDNLEKNKRTPGSISYVPAVAGLLMAGEIIRDLCLIA